MLPHSVCAVPIQASPLVPYLSKHGLSAAEILLLKKGLSFVPTPPKLLQPNYENGLAKVHVCHRYKNRFSLPIRSERLIDCNFEAIRYDLSSAEILQPEANLAKAERSTPYRLKRMKFLSLLRSTRVHYSYYGHISHGRASAQEHKHLELAHKNISTYTWHTSNGLAAVLLPVGANAALP